MSLPGFRVFRTSSTAVNCSNCTGVQEALAVGHIQCLKRLIGNDAEKANEEDPKTGLTPLMKAVVLDGEYNPSRIIKCLVNLGADVTTWRLQI